MGCPTTANAAPTLYCIETGMNNIVPIFLTLNDINTCWQNKTAVEQALLEISNPHHPRYGGHLGQQGLKELVRLHPDLELMVLTWLAASNISHCDVGEWLTVETTLEKAESLLRTKFRVCRNLKYRLPGKLRTGQYSVPVTLYNHIQMMQPALFGFHQQTEEEPSLKGLSGIQIQMASSHCVM